MNGLTGMEKFSHLEDKIYLTIAFVKKLREEKEQLEKENAELKRASGTETAQLEEKIEKLLSERDAIQLKVEAMLEAMTMIDTEVAEAVGAAFLVAFTSTGDSARRLARYRGPIPILAFTTTDAARSQRAMTWGVETFKMVAVEHTDEMVRQVDEALLQAVQRVIEGIPAPVLHRVVARPLDVEGATRRLFSLLEEKEEFGWREALGPAPTITDVLSTLLALLELARRGTVSLTQAAAFAPMVIRRDTSRPAD